jgi:hypothetical protein
MAGGIELSSRGLTDADAHQFLSIIHRITEGAKNGGPDIVNEDAGD